jgi:tRNA (guanine-N(7)-)-methyltransferase subunit TRM82
MSQNLGAHASRSVPKKISAAAFSADGRFAMFADKFGDVHIAATAGLAAWRGAPDQASQPCKPLLGHFCSIITGLLASPDGRFVASCDRDHKIRVSVMPADPLQALLWLPRLLARLQDFHSIILITSSTCSNSRLDRVVSLRCCQEGIAPSAVHLLEAHTHGTVSLRALA